MRWTHNGKAYGPRDNTKLNYGRNWDNTGRDPAPDPDSPKVPGGMRMTLEAAKDAILGGVHFGDVYPVLEGDADRADLKEWFVRTPALPNTSLREAPAKPQTWPTGELCQKCGGFMVRTGSCLTCQVCSESSGGCS